MARPIYVEIRIRAPLEEVWRRTQTPELHERWDLRFTDIVYLPRAGDEEPQRFLYRTRIGFGFAIDGTGETAGTRESGGRRTSALRFASADWKSLIREGSGYWRYEPEGDEVRFLTQYDYRVRYRWLGRAIDAAVFRPLLGWATAWSFDRLRLWLERDWDPGLQMCPWLAHAAARIALALVWIWQGLVPKLLFPDRGEIELLRRGGFFGGNEEAVLAAVGAAEILLGLALLAFWRHRALLWIQFPLLVALDAGALLSDPSILVEPFNPASLSLACAGLAAAALLCGRDLPSARACLRRPPEEER